MSVFYIGLKLGSTTTCIYKSGNGIVLKEPSLIAMSSNLKIKDVKAVGTDAKNLKGKSSDNIAIFSPIQNGAIKYEELATLMLKEFLKRVFPEKKLGQNIKAILCLPLGLSPAEKKQFEIVCFKAGIADVYIVPDIICYALGNGIDVKSNTSSFIVNIGGDETNIASISNLSIIDGYNISFGGSIISIAIAKYVDETYNIKISPEQAEQIKIEVCSLIENYNATTTLVGIDMATNMRREQTISSSELYPIVSHYYSKIADAIISVIKESSPEVVADIAKNGIYFYGGATMIVGLEMFMAKKLNLKINVSEIQKVDVLGTSELIKYPQMLKRIIKNN